MKPGKRKVTAGVKKNGAASVIVGASTSRAPMPVALTDKECARAARLLVRMDPRFGPVIKRVGRCRLPDSRTHHPFLSLARAVVSQQLSGKAAATIFGRVVDLVGGPEGLTPSNLLAAEPEALRAAGLSRQKISYLRDLAEHVSDGRLDLHTLKEKSDEEVIAAITAVKGFGRWTAEMFLMFQLNRPDVFPVGDLGIMKGVQRVLGMKSKPRPVTMTRAAESWRPYRSVASWYLWRILEETAVAAKAPAVKPVPTQRTATRKRIQKP